MNRWCRSSDMRQRLRALLDGAMIGSTLYVVPFLLGDPSSEMVRVGVELTDSLPLVLELLTTMEVGDIALAVARESGVFSRGLRSVRDLGPAGRVIAHFPDESLTVDIGPAEDGDGQFAKRCHSVLLATYRAFQEGWLAENMQLLRLESPRGEKTYFATATPGSLDGSGLFASQLPPIFEGWKLEKIGNGLTWLKAGCDGKLHACGPDIPSGEIEPLDAIIFGGERSSTMPLVFECIGWTHGVYTGATLSSEIPVPTPGDPEPVQRNPMAILPFCGYHVGDYLSHWLNMRKALTHPPKIFRVNWFRKSEDGMLLWPGFAENLRVLKWMADRVHDRATVVESPIGWLPRHQDIEWRGLDFSESEFERCLEIDPLEWRAELDEHGCFFNTLAGRVPIVLREQRSKLLEYLDVATRASVPSERRAFLPFFQRRPAFVAA